MRLGQLARKLALRPSEIVDFLASQQIQIEDNVNTRIEESLVGLILHKFSPSPLIQETAQAIIEEDEILVLERQELVESSTNKPISEAIDEPAAAEENTDVIKAPKVELQGLKVLGKITLPEKKKIEPEKEDATPAESIPEPTTEKKPESSVRRPQAHKRARAEQRLGKNPIEAAREREELERRQKRDAQAESEKEQRTKNYYKRVKVSSPTKRARLIDEQSDEMPAAELMEAPKTLFGKIAKWFKT